MTRSPNRRNVVVGIGGVAAALDVNRALGQALYDVEEHPGVMATAMTEESPPFGIKSVDHTGITVSSLDEAVSFWVGAMGFEHLYTWDFENTPFLEELVGVKGAAMRLAMVKGPGHLIELLEYRAPDDRQILKPRSCDIGSVHVAFYVADIDALLARLSTMGWNALGRVQTVESGERAGLRLAYVRGPDGMTLEFLQRPEDALAPSP